MERWKVENQEHVTSDLVVCGGKENDWLHLLGGEETCPVAEREGNEGMAMGAGGRAASPGPYQFALFLFQVHIHQTLWKCASLPRRGSTSLTVTECASSLILLKEV